MLSEAFRRSQGKSFVNLDIWSLPFGSKCWQCSYKVEMFLFCFFKKRKTTIKNDLIRLFYLWTRWRDSHTCDINAPGCDDLPHYAQLKRGLTSNNMLKNLKCDLWSKQKVGGGCFMVKAINNDSRLWDSNHRSVTLNVTLGGLLETFKGTLHLYVRATHS